MTFLYGQMAQVIHVQCLAFLPRDARSAKRGSATVSRPSVCLSVCDVDVRGLVCWVSSKPITGIISLWSSLPGATTSAV